MASTSLQRCVSVVQRCNLTATFLTLIIRIHQNSPALNLIHLENFRVRNEICLKTSNRKKVWKNNRKNRNRYVAMDPCTILRSNFENIRLWDKVCPKQMNNNIFEKIIIKITVRILQCTILLRFTQSGEYQIL